MAMLIEPLGLTTPVAAFNGGVFLEPDLMTVLDQLTLPKDVAEVVVARLLSAGLDVWVYQGSDWFIRDRDAPHVAREQKTVQFAPTVIADLNDVLDGARHSPRCKQGHGRAEPFAHAGRSARGDRNDRRHAERRVDVRTRGAEHRDGQRESRRATRGASRDDV
jgi:hypothetical protein